MVVIGSVKDQHAAGSNPPPHFREHGSRIEKMFNNHICADDVVKRRAKRQTCDIPKHLLLNRRMVSQAPPVLINPNNACYVPEDLVLFLRRPLGEHMMAAA